ncbi:tetratricopeptide repeat protein 13-like isoform X2 [Mercenaria mercenaria]|uniref:tetratricopeptide repeat protein 13-like isoform X2 n=1 Tax=Mercenaria mercenaria TaxID=6596 RepID=UPI00234F9952|nr:tetratricopeptide repeat protein 13-like isoform X2 [Mercenaria mercenaria]
MARVKYFITSLILLNYAFTFTTQVELMCEVANVKVESEDGRTQTFEMKRLESVKGEACSLCAFPAVNNAPELSALKSQLTLYISDKELSPVCDPARDDLPLGLCSFHSDLSTCQKNELDNCYQMSENFGEDLVQRKLLPFATGDEEIDKILGLGLVLLNSGNIDAAIDTYDNLISNRPNTLAAYFMRGVAYSRKGLKDQNNAYRAIDDFRETLERDSKFIQAYERRAEANIALQQYSKAINDLTKVLELKTSSKIQFARGVVYLLLQDYTAAEEDFKKNIDNDGDDLQSLFYLGLSQYYRGKVRNAIEVFKEVLSKDPDHLDACTSLAQAFREIGNLRMSRSKFNQSLSINKDHVMSLQLRGNLLYHSGEPQAAIKDFKKCIEEDRDNINCAYMKALSATAVGRFYDGVKSATKVMVQNRPVLKASPDFLKAHYLREYARYLHANLDQSLESLTVDTDFSDDFKDHWLKNLPFEFQGSYKEQPGIQPHIKDVSQLEIGDYPRPVQNLICKAHKIGWLMQVNTDGYTPNKRLNLAMGLSSIHIAQLYEKKWRDLRQNKAIGWQHSWRDLFNIAVRYRRLVDPEQPVLWLDKMPDHKDKDGYKTVITLVKGSVHNIKTMPYFNLVFKLVKTMLEHYSVTSEIVKSKQATAKEEIEGAKTCEDLLEVTKAGLFSCTSKDGSQKHQTDQNGFVVSTQVPSTRKRSEKDRLEGAMLVLTDDLAKQILFTIDVANTRTRTFEYHTELDYIYNQLQDEIKRTSSSKVSEMDSVVNIILSLAYYFYNLMPLSRGSSVVAYSVALGLIMSIHRQVTGKLPTSKLLEMEAMLSGAPDAFILVTKQWMNIKRLASPMSGHPTVWETFPTVRSVLEVLNVNTDSCS